MSTAYYFGESIIPKAVLGLSVLAMGSALNLATVSPAYAVSDGCAAISRGELNITTTNTAPGPLRSFTRAFEAGEIITVALTGTISDSFAEIGGNVLFLGAVSGATNSFTVPSTASLLVESDIETTGGTGTITWRCSSGVSASDQQANAQITSGLYGEVLQQFVDVGALPGVGDFTSSGDASRAAATSAGPADFRRRSTAEINEEILTLRSRVRELEFQISLERSFDEPDSPASNARIRPLTTQRDQLLARIEQLEAERDGQFQGLDDSAGLAQEASDIELFDNASGVAPSADTEPGILVPGSRVVFFTPPDDASSRVSEAFQSLHLSAFAGGAQGSAFSAPTDTAIPVMGFARASATFLTGANDGLIGNGQVGLSARLTDGLVVGSFLLGTLGSTESTVGTRVTDTNIVGFGGGIYGSLSFLETATASFSASYVVTDNDMTSTVAGGGVTTGSYDGSNLHLTASLGNSYQVGDFDITASAGGSYAANTTDTYTDSNGIQVAASDSEDISVDAGLRIARAFAVDGSFVQVVRPWVSTNARLFLTDRNDTISAGQVIFSQETANYALGTGVSVGFVGDGTFDLDLRWNNVASDSESVTINGRLSIPLGSVGR